MINKTIESYKPYELASLKTQLIYTTNPRFGYYGAIGRLSCHDTMAYFDSVETNFHTSYITKLVLVDDVLEIYTRNSLYKFRVLSKDFLEWTDQGVQFELTQEQITTVENYIKGFES